MAEGVFRKPPWRGTWAYVLPSALKPDQQSRASNNVVLMVVEKGYAIIRHAGVEIAYLNTKRNWQAREMRHWLGVEAPTQLQHSTVGTLRKSVQGDGG